MEAEETAFSSALQTFLRGSGAAGAGWETLAFFRDGAAAAIAARLDSLCRSGAVILPDAGHTYRAFELTPRHQTRVVILGQDPYPTPGDAHGLAFSHVGGRRLPASLKNILKEMAADTGVATPASGDLTPWAEQGVLLLNTALSVEAGRAGAHLSLGWSRLAAEVVENLSAGPQPVVFLLWGNAARSFASRIDTTRHLVLEAGHPSPLNRLRDFAGCRHFSKANAWLAARGAKPVDWRL
ncbi:MAG: uracil-DNA glycosylase [Methylobacteriaceae bacterium]|jgi:uracil-DNA glycosylase|nr:uracil-DNA glycosylase [Methylobacteriaceae bacterium]